MRLRVAHNSMHRYEPPAVGVIQVLRLTPRNHDGQYVMRWRIDVSADARLAAHEDAFGNLTHVFAAEGPLGELTVEVNGEVETQNTDGVVRGTVERFPPSMFLRDTPLTEADAAIREFAHDVRAASGDGVLAGLHALMQRVHDGVVCDGDSSPATTTAAEAFARRRGATGDLAHIFIGMARSLGIPTRFIAGYCWVDGATERQHGHVWTEAYVPDLGWVGFDPANAVCPTEAYIRVAVGLDALGAAPVRGTRYGAGAETSAIAIKVGQ